MPQPTQARPLQYIAPQHSLLQDQAAFVRLGLLLLATDLTTERDVWNMVAAQHPRVRLHVSRIFYANPVTPENLRAMAPRLAEGASLLPPETPLAAVYFACTSGSVVIGDDVVIRAVRGGRPQTQQGEPELPVLTPVTAALEALQALGARRISVLTPYDAATSAPLQEYFQHVGLTVCSLACLGLEDDRDMARIDPGALVQAAVAAVHPEAEALFISCTALRSAEVAGRIEELTGKPVVTSNQASCWRMLRLCGLETPGPAYGKLMELHPQA